MRSGLAVAGKSHWGSKGPPDPVATAPGTDPMSGYHRHQSFAARLVVGAFALFEVVAIEF